MSERSIPQNHHLKDLKIDPKEQFKDNLKTFPKFKTLEEALKFPSLNQDRNTYAWSLLQKKL